MTAYAKIKKIRPRLPCASVEVLCTEGELDILIKKLLDFKDNVQKCTNNHNKEDYIHTHYQDGNYLWKPNDCDLVFYINLAQKQSGDGS